MKIARGPWLDVTEAVQRWHLISVYVKILCMNDINFFFISDIKPENLLISKDDTLKLCDFGKF